MWVPASVGHVKVPSVYETMKNGCGIQTYRDSFRLLHSKHIA